MNDVEENLDVEMINKYIEYVDVNKLSSEEVILKIINTLVQITHEGKDETIRKIRKVLNTWSDQLIN